MTILDLAKSLDLHLITKFIPADPKTPFKDLRLTWEITLTRHDKPILTTTYSAGIGHCPSYNPSTRLTSDYVNLIRYECEHGLRGLSRHWTTPPVPHPYKTKIQPDPASVLACLALDAEAIDYPDYRTWADNLGYDPDSRKGEAIYRTCLDHGLKLRAALGDENLRKLQELGAEL